MNSLSPTTFLHPFVERASFLEQRVYQLLSFQQFLKALIEGKGELIADTDRDFLIRYLGAEDNVDSEQLFKNFITRSVGIRKQLTRCIAASEQPLQHLMLCCHQCRDLMRTGDYSTAAKLLFDLEGSLLTDQERVMEFVRTLLIERIENRSQHILALADLLADSLVTKICKNISSEDSQENPSLNAPAFYIREILAADLQLLARTQSFSALTRFTLPMAKRLPLLSEASLCTLPIMRRVYAELGLDTEIQSIFHTISHSHNHPSTRPPLMLRWRAEIVAEIMATLCSGPAYAATSLEALSADATTVMSACTDDDIPAYLRWAIQWTTLAKIGFYQESEKLQRTVQGLYGPIEFATSSPAPRPELKVVLHAVQPIVLSLLETPLTALGQKTLRVCLPIYALSAQERSFEIAQQMLEENNLLVSAKIAEPVERKDQEKNRETGSKLCSGITEMQALISALRSVFEQASINGLHVKQFSALAERYVSNTLPTFQEQVVQTWPLANGTPLTETSVV
jgi:hypothetical protein